MNDLYFACADCKIYINAGYRWAYWQLEHTGIVDRKKNVNVSAVLENKDYWNPPDDENSRWLREEIFSPLKEFLAVHGGHRIVFGTSEDFAPDNDDYFFEWMQSGYLARTSVRYLFEVLGLRSWDEVTRHMEAQKMPPAWWYDTWSENPSLHEKAKLKFETLVQSRSVG
jgi:hypothetical protein